MSEMSTRPAPHAFTVEDFYRMAEAGILSEDDRVELLDGQIVDMSPIGSRHAACVKRLAHILSRVLEDRAILSVQDPVRLDPRSEPQPDIALVRPRADFYAEAHPGPADVLLVIEVAEATVLFDRNVKVPLYARAGVPECWVVDLAAACVETYGAPGPSGYREAGRAVPGETLSPRALSAVTLEIAEIVR